ncbi:Anthocyanidin reductase ((2S)-flavan-3-ol-forming) [Linum grandiflorum]
MEQKSQTKVCVTGGTGYIGSCLVKKLLQTGYTVHATLRSLDDKAKVGLLTSLPNAETNLVLFKADIYNPDQFQSAIDGCQFVFHVAYPLQHHSDSATYKDRIEAMAEGSKRIAEACLKSGTVKRLIYTASVMAASPLFDDGSEYGPTVHESCWTPLHVSFQYSDPFTLDYTRGKTMAEKEMLKFNETSAGGRKMEVVSLAAGLVGGETILSQVPLSAAVIICPATGNLFGYNHGLMFMQELLGSVPLVHVEDLCEALIFCMEKKTSVKGRFICAAGSLSVREIATYIRDHYPELHVDATLMGEAGKGIEVDNSKLKKMGFNYKYDTMAIIDECLECAKRLGALPDL